MAKKIKKLIKIKFIYQNHLFKKMNFTEEISQKQINKIGKKFRDSIYDENDYIFLEDFKKSYDQLLIDKTSNISEIINKELNNFVLVGRLKRTNSIIRKLQRKNNYGMDLTRMSDIAGLRLIVNNMEDQNLVINIIKSQLSIEKIYDYRDSDQNYRSVHLVSKVNDKFIEIQIRTVAQQTWADESEGFGEHAKQGFYSEQVGEYLKILSNVVHKIDNGFDHNKEIIDHHLFEKKSPIKGKYTIIKKIFDNYKNNYIDDPKYFLIVYDSLDSTLISEDEFDLDEKNDVFELYRYKAKILDSSRYEIIFFISSLGNQVLRVSHPRFFMR